MAKLHGLQADYAFRGVDHVVRMSVEGNLLEVEVEDRLTTDQWRGEFDAACEYCLGLEVPSPLCLGLQVPSSPEAGHRIIATWWTWGEDVHPKGQNVQPRFLPNTTRGACFIRISAQMSLNKALFIPKMN